MKTPSFMRLVRAIADRRGVTALEYGLVAALAAVAIIIAMANIGTSLESVITGISGKLTSTAAGIN